MVRDIEALREGWRLMCAHFASKRLGRESPFTYNQIVDAAVGFARELGERGDYSSPRSRELFRIVSGRLGREGVSIGKAFDGLYLVEPHSRLIWKGFKKLIVKLKRYEGKMHVPLYLLGDKAYGFITLTSVRMIDRDEFEALGDRHLISQSERLRWWGDKFPLHVYEFRFERFSEPKEYVRPPGAQVFIDDVRIERVEKVVKELDFDLEAVDSKHVADLNDSELVTLYRKLHGVYRERGEVFEALLNASIFVESEMERRNLERMFDDELSRETKFWISEYPVPVQKAQRIITLQEVFDSFPESVKLPVDVPSICICGGLANRGWVTDHDIDLRVALDEFRADIKKVLLASCSRDDVREKLSIMFDTRGGIGHSVPLYIPVSGVLTKDSGLRVGKPSQPQKSASGELKYEFWEVEDAWRNWAAPRVERGILIEPKWDGMSFQTHIKDGRVIGIYTEDQLRNRVEAFKGSVEELPKLLKAKDAILAVEMVEYSDMLEWPENKPLWEKYKQIPREDLIKGDVYFEKWIAGKTEGLDDKRVVFQVHDLLFLDGEDFTGKGALERLSKLREILKGGEHWNVTESWQAKDLKSFEAGVDGARFYPNSEGAMLKAFDSDYKVSYDVAGRNREIAKIKNLKSIDVMVFEPHLVSGTKDVYTWEGYIGPVPPKKDLVKYREQDLKNWKGKPYLRIGTCYNVKGKHDEGEILEVKPVRIEWQEEAGKRFPTWMFPKVGMWRPEKREPDPIDVAEKLAKLGTRPMPRKSDDSEPIYVRLPECPDKYVFDEDVCPLLHRVKIEVDGVWKGQKVLVEELKYPIEDCKLANFYKCRRVKEYYTGLREVGADEWEKRKVLRTNWKET